MEPMLVSPFEGDDSAIEMPRCGHGAHREKDREFRGDARYKQKVTEEATKTRAE